MPRVLRRSAAPWQRWPLYLAVGLALVLWCAVDVQRRGRVDPDNPNAHKTDFTAYTIGGAAFFDGRDPYSVTNIRGWGYCYPPLFAMLVSPLDALDPRWQVTIWFFVSAAVAWGIYRECARLFETFAPWPGSSLPKVASRAGSPGRPWRPLSCR